MARPTSVNTDYIPMATGAKGSNPRSAGNVMPGANAMSSRAGTPPSGGTGGIRGIPSRNGPAPVAGGSYMNQPGSPGQNSPLTPGGVPASSLGGASKAILTHGRTLGAIAHLRSIGADHPHLAQHHAKATSALAGMKKSKQGLPGGPKFGALGGSNSSGAVGTGVPGVGMGAPGAQPLGMSQLPDEM